MATIRGQRARRGADERVLLGDGRLSVTLEDVKSGQFYQSLVPLEGESLEQIFEHYLSQSEQITAFLRLYADARRALRAAAREAAGADSPRPRRLEPHHPPRLHPRPSTKRATPSPTTCSRGCFPRS